MTLSAHLAGLQARFDRLALRPPATPPDEAALARQHATTLAALHAWCWQGAGPGNSPWLHPGGRPAVGQRLAVGALRATDGALASGGTAATAAAIATAAATATAAVTATATAVVTATATATANTWARQIDGSARLDALPSRAAGLRFRLQTKQHDAMWWRPRQPDDPWDAGWAVNTPPALRQIKNQFMPRRATLILADRAEAEPLRLCLAALVARSDDFRHPVRWVWVGGDSDIAPAHGLAVARFALH